MRTPIEYTLDGKTFEVVPDYAFIARVEEREGMSLMKLGRRLESEEIRVCDLAWVLHCAQRRAGYTDYSEDDIGNLVLRDGIEQYAIALFRILNAVFGAAPTEEYQGESGEPGKAPTAGSPTESP